MKYHLRLSKGLSYHGVLSATKQRPDVYTDSKDVADRAVASGYFRLIGVADAPKQPDPNVGADPAAVTLDPEQLNTMSTAELRRLAGEMGIEAKGLGKAELVKAIAEVEVTPGPVTDEDGIDLEQA